VGLAVAGLALPAAVAAGAGVRVVADSVDSLPGELVDPALPQRTVLLAADGSPLATLFLYDRELASLDEIAPVMQDAIISVEDERFYDHVGVDVRGTARAMVNNSAGGATQGGSTLTQQYVKNALLLAADTPEEAEAAKAPTIDRKLREARLAVAVERESTKEEILEKYLNIAYFGDGAYGVQAAARHYFGVPASQLTLTQAATLAGVVRNPARDPKRDPESALERRDLVLARMLGTGAITQTEHDAAVATPLGLNPVALEGGCGASWAPFFCDWVRATLESDPALGATEEERKARLFQGGLVVRTTLDPVAQRAAQEAVDSTIPRRSRVATAAVSVRPGTGEVTAMAVNRGFGPDAAAGQTENMLPSLASFQPGSTFKMFTLAAALERGVPVTTRLPGGNAYTSRRLDNPPAGYFSNAGSESGSNLDLRGATAHSVNTAFVQLQEMTGTQAVADMARRLGLANPALEQVSPRFGSLTLGAVNASPVEMAGAYAAVAGRGVACRPVGVTAISDAEGRAHPVPAANCHQAVSPAVADTVASLMTSVITEGTGRRADIGRPVAGKTGTTQGNAEAWFAGFTPDLATAVWVGDPRGAHDHPLVNVLGYRRVYGGDLPAIIFAKTMRGALANVPPTPLPSPDGNAGALAAGPRVPNVAGLPQAEAVARLTELG
ncbi:MAG: penicillin-binding protein, partial [Actinomycetota bacterium]|nr:penicillin-binding protein [Actinomycetota bacterium]